MAHLAVGGVAGPAGIAECRVADVTKIGGADLIGGAGGRQVVAEVDAVYHHRKVDAGYGAAGVARVVAEHAILGLVAVLAVQRKPDMALVALGGIYYRTALDYRRTIHREVDDFVIDAVLGGHLFDGSRQHNQSAARFHADGERALGAGRDGVGHGVSAGAVLTALGKGRGGFGDITGSGHAGERGVAVVGGGTDPVSYTH